MPQDTLLFNNTIQHNIAFDQPSATSAQVIEAAKSARIHDFIAATPLVNNTMVGERRLKLSCGQRQCVVIAHRLSTVVDAHEILVMDDGCIIERGTHAELLGLNQKYASIWNLQQSAE